MFQRILVPLDGSSRAERAIPVAARLARASAGTVILVRVVQTMTAPIEEGGMLTASEKGRRYLSMTADHLREGFVAPAIAKLNLAITWSVAVDMYVAETLIRAAEPVAAPEWGEMVGDIDVIALATHGRDGLQRWVMGSVTERILLDTKLPLLVVPPEWQHKTAGNEQQKERGITELHLPEAVSIW